MHFNLLSFFDFILAVIAKILKLLLSDGSTEVYEGCESLSEGGWSLEWMLSYTLLVELLVGLESKALVKV
jgi:hypothetical protein